MKNGLGKATCNEGTSLMANDDLGANQFTFAGDRTQISYETQTPIPSQGPLLWYEGPEGDDTFTGNQITRLDSALGNFVTVVLRPNADTGGITITVLVPKACGVTPRSPGDFRDHSHQDHQPRFHQHPRCRADLRRPAPPGTGEPGIPSLKATSCHVPHAATDRSQ